jgi:hypothetical protein
MVDAGQIPSAYTERQVAALLLALHGCAHSAKRFHDSEHRSAT